MLCKPNAVNDYIQWPKRSQHSPNAVQNYCFFLNYKDFVTEFFANRPGITSQ